MILTFTLIQAAKSKGGDKYVCDTIPEFSIYIPQTISRGSEKTPRQTIQIDIN